MLEFLRHFAFEAMVGGIGLALIVAGIALLAAPQATLVERIPFIGAFVASIRTSAATVLIAAGVGALAYVGGYMHRGSIEQEAALRDKIATQAAIKKETERREDAFAAARAADAEYADQLAVENKALRDMQRMHNEASHAADNRPGLRRDGVRRLNAIGRAGRGR